MTIVVTGAAGTERSYSGGEIDIVSGVLVVKRGDAPHLIAAYAPGCWAIAHEDGALASEAEGDPKGRALYIAVSALTSILTHAKVAAEDLREIAEKALAQAAEAHPGLRS